MAKKTTLAVLVLEDALGDIFSWSHQAFRQRLIIFWGAQDVSTLYSLEPAPAKGGILWTFGAAHAGAAPSKPESHCLPCCYHGEHIIIDVNPHGVCRDLGLAKTY